ncbi:MAG: hypothetical protein QNJ35_00455, partial [Paracoccaceae bacterium]|nr:hypothetical protein [Paracoccaceae bacterium]
MRFTRCSPRTLAFLASALALCAANDALAQSFKVVEPSEGFLSVDDDEITARLRHGACDPGYEDACTEKSQLQSSEYLPTLSHAHGDTVTYRWEILVPEDFAYETVSGDLRAGRLYNDSGEAIQYFLLDGDSGLTINRKVCFDPEGFGEWHSIEVLAVWDSTKKKGFKDKTPGSIRVSCDGSEVHASSGRPTVGEGQSVWLALGLRG